MAQTSSSAWREKPLEHLEHWRSFVRHTPLGILTDLDGTLLPFAPTPEEVKVGPGTLALLRELAALPGIKIAVVSGRLRESLGALLGDATGVGLVAEHGGWDRAAGAWQPMIHDDPHALDDLTPDLERIAQRYRGAMVERKTWSVTLH